MKYEELRQYSDDEIHEIMSAGDVEKMKLLPLSIGEYHCDFSFAQNLCVELLKTSADDEIRANAVLGLSYLARRFRRLDKIIIPDLQNEMKNNKAFIDRVEYSIEDIFFFMGW